MASDPRHRTFAASLTRPEHVADWNDTNDVLSERMEALTSELGGDWELEGPLFEGGMLTLSAVRALDETRQHALNLTLDPTPEGGDMPESVPATLSFSLDVEETDAREDVPPLGNLWSSVIMALELLATSASGYGIWRVTGSSALSALGAFVGFVLFFVAGLFASSWLARALHRPLPPAPPSSAFVALVEQVERHLRSDSPFVDVRES